MSLLHILLIVGLAVIVLIAVFIIIGKISASKKKVINKDIAKKLGKIKKEDAKNHQPVKEEKKEAFDLEPPKLQVKVEQPKNSKNVHPIVTNFDELDNEDKDFLGISDNDKVVERPKEEVRRKSFEELMKAHQANRANYESQKNETFDDDDFEKFRAQHSSFSSYKKDDVLIDEIKELSPEMKAIVFSNLFRRIDHD